MKLRNKETGEIKELTIYAEKFHLNDIGFAKGETIEYNSLAKLNEEWEDYEEPKDFYIVEQRGNVGSRFRTSDEYVERFKQIGNYFETKEEAEKAVEKLKAWKRLKDKGFRFKSFSRFDGLVYGRDAAEYNIKSFVNDKSYEIETDIDLLFGGEE